MNIKDYPPDKIVYTTKTVVKEDAPILYISLDEENDFQMFGEEDPDSNNAMMVSLQQMLSIDASLLQLPRIEKGQAYVRSNKETAWEVYK